MLSCKEDWFWQIWITFLLLIMNERIYLPKIQWGTFHASLRVFFGKYPEWTVFKTLWAWIFMFCIFAFLLSENQFLSALFSVDRSFIPPFCHQCHAESALGKSEVYTKVKYYNRGFQVDPVYRVAREFPQRIILFGLPKLMTVGKFWININFWEKRKNSN